MAITTGDGYIAASKQIVTYVKTANVTTSSATANRWTNRGAAGNPGAGTLAAPTGAPGGALLTDASSGMPLINAFGAGNTGYLTRVNWNTSVTSRVELWDAIYAYNIPTGASGFGSLQTLTLSSQPTITGRTPDGAGSGLRMFVEITTTMSASATTVTCTYTNSGGVGSRTTASSGSLSGFVAGRWIELALQAGDSGIQRLDTIVIGGATNAAGVANILICRPLWASATRVANSGTNDGIDMTGMPIVYDTSALVVTTIPDSSNSGLTDLMIEIANG